jgi:parvulin-like peptidyl-prolyl isomerase
MGLSESKSGSAAALVAASVAAAMCGLVVGIACGILVSHKSIGPSSGVVATVNGTEITQDQFMHGLETASTTGPTGPMGVVVLRKMVDDELTVQFAAKMGVPPTQSQIDTRYNQLSKQPDFAERLTRSHQTEQDAKHVIEVSLAQQNVWSKGVTVTDADVRAYYASLSSPANPRAPYYRPETVSVERIGNDDPAQIERAISDLDHGGSFPAVARAYSKDPSASNGGVMPPIRRGSQEARSLPGLEERLFGLKPGQRIDRLKSGKAIWIIQCISHQPEASVPFAKVKDDCQAGATVAKGLKTYGKERAQQFQDFRKSASIMILWPQYKSDVH